MFIHARLALLFFASLLGAAAACAQQPTQPAHPDDKIYLDVVVTPKSGPPVTGLQQQDFTLLDNKAPRPIASFQAIAGSQAPLEVILVIDAVNTDYQNVAFEREQIDKFLRADGGHLAHPTALAYFTDTGTEVQDSFTADGNALSASLDQYVVGLRSLRRSAGFYGATERLQLSLNALQQLAAREATRPGRKVILWVSPGWPLLSGPEVQLDSKQQQEIFESIVSFSTRLRQARITLYSIDPLGSKDFGTRSFYYESFLKGVSEPRQANLGNLGLQVLAVQTGGLALTINNDVTAELQQCISDTGAYYELSFVSPLDAKPNEYHRLEIKLANSGLTARTRQGYYAQPEVKELHKLHVVESPTR